MLEGNFEIKKGSSSQDVIIMWCHIDLFFEIFWIFIFF